MKLRRSYDDSIDPGVLHTTTLVALVAAIIVAVLPPTLHFYYGVQLQRSGIAAEAKAAARQVSQLVGRNPAMWRFETLRIDEFLGALDATEIKTVRMIDGAHVTSVGQAELKWPTTATVTPVFDAGHQVAELEIQKTLRPEFLRTLVLLAFSMALACFVFAALRILPLGILRRVIKRADFLASHDSLTDLPNRALFNDWLIHAIAEAEQQNVPLAVLCLDLDHFKEVNDILGHAAGDILLKQAAARMSKILRKGDILARLGGDEFAVIQSHVDHPNTSAKLAERLIQTIARPFDLDGQEVLVGASIGITILDRESSADGPKLMQQSDLALYRAKAEGRGRFCFFIEDMNQKLLERKQTEIDLRKAIANDELQLHFQPQIDLAADEIVGVEALLRWHHPSRGCVLPDSFIPLAEETGLILQIGDWVLRRACQQARDWPNLKFAVNVSPVQFRQGNLVETIRRALEEAEVEPGRLEIEITEGVLLDNTDETIAILTRIKELGVRIAMDDFGTGYSSLSYLRRFCFDKIKIDRSFVSGLGRSADADSIIKAVITLGASLGMVSNAEGVETAEQVDLLRQQGCREVQGFYFGHPMPSQSISELIKDWEFQKAASKVTALKTGAPDPIKARSSRG